MEFQVIIIENLFHLANSTIAFVSKHFEDFLQSFEFSKSLITLVNNKVIA